ncbi:MAG: AAA family ATPase [Myxococcota bacterium]
MTAFSLTVQNLRGLRGVEWTPEGVCLLVGANGAGKTTVFLTLKMLRAAVARGLPEAVRLVFGGSHGLKHRDASDDEAIRVGVESDGLRWSIQLTPRGTSVDYLTEEVLVDGDEEIFRRDGLGKFTYRGKPLESDERLGLRKILDRDEHEPAVERAVSLLERITVFHEPDLTSLRRGSDTAQTSHLHSRGLNALTMLRQWHQSRPDRERYQFVLTGLKAAFPGLIEDLDFDEAGNTIAGRVYRPGREAPEPLANEANGVVAMLVLLCDLAAAEEGGIVAIDEPENSLHPFAIRAFLRRADKRARKKNLTILLATHSPALLDAFDATPEQVYVLRRDEWPGPTPLPELKNPDWLRAFRLGELYVDGSIASNDERR